MKRLRWAAFVLLAITLSSGAGSQEKTAVELKVVKYDGLAEAIVKNRGKVVLVDFWANYCLPCKQTFPHVVELHKKHAREGLAVISVSLDELGDDRKDTERRVLAFLQKQGAEFTNLLLDEDAGIWQTRLRFPGPPCYYVFNRQGKWTRFYSDDDKGVDYTAMDKLVQELLREK